MDVSGALRGGWFPDRWEVPVAIGLGVVITGYIGDAIAGFISQWVPAEWLNPATEIIAGVILFMLGGFIGGDMSMWARLFSMGAFAVGIADAVTVLLGMGGTAAAVNVRQVNTASSVRTSAGLPQGTYR